jgi:GTP-binding protein
MAVRSLERADVALVVTDAADGFTDQDASVARTRARQRLCNRRAAQQVGLVHERGARSARAKPSSNARFAADRRSSRSPRRLACASSKILPLVRKLAKAARRRIPTAGLNRWLKEATDAHEPAMAQRGTRKRPLRLLYATQVGVRPPSIVIFCSDPAGVKESYLRYL